MRKSALLPAMLLCLAATGCTVQSVAVDAPAAGVRFSVSAYPDLVLVPGLPVYYAPWVGRNYFFYDGMYWVFEGDNWYASYWYNGPWNYVRVDYVPVFILRVPVYYYRRPPVYFRAWHANEAPRWGERWGRDWEARHPDWRRRDLEVPPPAPRPDYQRRYRGRDYPAPGEQQELRRQHYGYQPRERVELSGAQRPPERWQEQQEQWQKRRQEQQQQDRLQQQQEREQQQQDRQQMERGPWSQGRPDERGQRQDDRQRGREERLQRPDAPGGARPWGDPGQDGGQPMGQWRRPDAAGDGAGPRPWPGERPSREWGASRPDMPERGAAERASPEDRGYPQDPRQRRFGRPDDAEPSGDAPARGDWRREAAESRGSGRDAGSVYRQAVPADSRGDAPRREAPAEMMPRRQDAAPRQQVAPRREEAAPQREGRESAAPSGGDGGDGPRPGRRSRSSRDARDEEGGR